MNNYDKMNLTNLVRNMHRLEWAADTDDDPNWVIHHLNQRKYVINLILQKFITG
jgi:hypothetical protein